MAVLLLAAEDLQVFDDSLTSDEEVHHRVRPLRRRRGRREEKTTRLERVKAVDEASNLKLDQQ
jgi:hypothetical protein